MSLDIDSWFGIITMLYDCTFCGEYLQQDRLTGLWHCTACVCDFEEDSLNEDMLEHEWGWDMFDNEGDDW